MFILILPVERSRTGLYEPLLQENEREAIAELLQYLESKYRLLIGFEPSLELTLFSFNRSKRYQLF